MGVLSNLHYSIRKKKNSRRTDATSGRRPDGSIVKAKKGKRREEGEKKSTLCYLSSDSDEQKPLAGPRRAGLTALSAPPPPSLFFSISLPLFSPNIPFSACPGALWNETPCNQTTALLLKLSQTPRLFDVCVSSRHLSATPAPLNPLACTESAPQASRQGRWREI